MSESTTMVERLTLESMPFLIFIGAVMSLGSTFSIPIILLLISVHAGFLYWMWSLRKHQISISDIRFLFVPSVVWIIALYSGGYHVFPSFYDQAEHLIISNRILERCECGLLKQQTYGLFRPELIPGIAAIELAWSGETYRVYFTPLLLLYSTGWAIQHLAEQYTPKKLAITAPMVFLLMPIVIVYGRTMLLDVGIAGMIISSILYFRKIENKSGKYIVFFGAMIASIGMAKYPYLYLGPWIMVIFYIRNHKRMIKPFTLGWGAITFLHIIKNILLTGGVFSPMNQQIVGTMTSIKSTEGEIGDYGTLQFILEYVDQWSILLFICALVGFASLIKKERDILWHTWALIAPAIILHGAVLDFGWVRYSTPWLALACIGVPAFISSEKFSIRVNHKQVNPFLVSGLVILLLSVHQTSALLIEEREEVEIRAQVHWTIANIYVDAGRNVDDDASFVTGTSSWNLELYSGKTSNQFTNPNDPVYNSIIEYEASHLLTQTRGWRYDIDVNWTYLYGSPVMPFEDYWSGSTEGYLWSVNESRLSTHSWWTNQTITLLGDGSTFGDFMHLEHETMYVIPENTSVSKIIHIKNDSDLSSAYRAMSGGWTSAEVLCDSIIECRDLNRDDFLDERWLVWVAQD